MVSCLFVFRLFQARHWLTRAFEENPRAQDAAADLVRAAMDRHDFKTAQETLDKIKERCGPTELWADLQTLVMEARGEFPDDFLWRMSRMYPCAIGPRLVLARRMLAAGYEREAAQHLEILDGLGCAEAAYFRGVSANRRGDFARALEHMQRAHELNPQHEPTLQQIEALQVAMKG